MFCICRFAVKEFCPKANLAPEQLKERLKIYESTLAGIQGIDYTKLRLLVQESYRKLCSEEELNRVDRWFRDMKEDGYSFETYEPDVVPSMIQSQERTKETGNAFTNFAVQVMKMPTSYSDALSGMRPKVCLCFCLC